MFQSLKITTTTTKSLPGTIYMYMMKFLKQKRCIYNLKLTKTWQTVTFTFVPPFFINSIRSLFLFFSLEKKRKTKWQEYLSLLLTFWWCNIGTTEVIGQLFRADSSEVNPRQRENGADGAHMAPTPAPSETPSFPQKGQRPCQYLHITGMIDHNSFFWAVPLYRVNAYSGSPQHTDHWHGTT